MSAETDLYAALTAAAGVTAIVGTGAAARIYPDVVPQEIELPAVAFLRGETEYVHTLGALAVDQRAALDVVCMAVTRAAAESLATAVEAACITAQYPPTARRADYDHENGIWATVLTVDVWT